METLRAEGEVERAGVGDGRAGGEGERARAAAEARRLEAQARARADLCERLARVTYNGGRAREGEGARWKRESAAIPIGGGGVGGGAGREIRREDDFPCVMSGSAERLWRLSHCSDDEWETPRRGRDSIEDDRELAAIFEKVDISPSGPLEFESVPRASIDTIVSPKSSTADVYIDVLLTGPRHSRAMGSDDSTSSSSWDRAGAHEWSDECEPHPSSPSHADALGIRDACVSYVTPSSKFGIPKTPSAPLRHQHARRDADSDSASKSAVPAPFRERAAVVVPRALF